MKQRIEEELALIKQYFPFIEVKEHDGMTWGKVHAFKLPSVGWDVTETVVAFNFPKGFPAASPYGIYFPSGLSFNKQAFGGGCQFVPPFEGTWNMVSWTPQEGEWKPGVNVVKGSNMLSFLRSFSERFKEGV